MSDHRIVQCFGVKKRPGQPKKLCRRKFVWSAKGATEHRFGGNGTQACPHCGTLPDLAHPYNRFLNGELTVEEAKAKMPDYLEKLGFDPETGEKKDSDK